MNRITPVKASEDHVGDVASSSNSICGEGPNALPVTKPQAARKSSVHPPTSFRVVNPARSSTPGKDTSTPSSPTFSNPRNDEDADYSHGADAVEKGEDGLYHFSAEEVTQIAHAAVLAAHSPPSVFTGPATCVSSEVERPLPPPQQSTPTVLTQPTATAQYLYNLLKDTQHPEPRPDPSESGETDPIL